MNERDALIAELRRVFPNNVFAGPATQHNCAECLEIRAHLDGRDWQSIPREFVANNCDILPLLSQDAYVAFLAAWLREAMLEPDGGVAAMVMVNLHSSPPVARFMAIQAQVVVAAARLIATLSVWGEGDESNRANVEAIERAWAQEV